MHSIRAWRATCKRRWPAQLPCSRSRASRPISSRATASCARSTASPSRSSSGETLAVVGESGCGKSVTSLSIMRLVASPPGRIVEGTIRFQGTNLLDLSERAMRDIRGNDISMIFQEPMTSLNPVLTIGRQITETMVAAPGARSRLRRGTNAGDAAAGRHSRAGPAHQAIPARAFRRHAPARHDRHGACVRPQAADRRRADHRPRRHRPGADPRPDASAQEQDRRGDHSHHPQPGPGGRDGPARRGHVRRQEGRGGAGQGVVRQPAPPLYPGAARIGAATGLLAGGQWPRPARGDSRSGSVPQGAHRRLHLRAALPHATSRCREKYPPLEEKTAGHWVACWEADRLAGAAT